MQQNLDEADARASETEQRLYRELEEYMNSWDRECGRPQDISDNLANNAKQQYEAGRTLIKISQKSLEKTHQIGWSETAKTTRV